jgi:hypothetical protein
MDSSDTEADVPPASPAPKKRPVPVKALEALAKAREIKAKQREEAVKAKVEMKAKKEEAVKVVDQIRHETMAPAPTPVTAAPSTDYMKSLEEKLHALESKLVKPKKVKKKVIVEDSDSSTEEEVVIKRKPSKKTAPASHVDDGTIAAFREFQVKQMAMQQNADKEKEEKDRLRALFSRK